MEEMGLGGAYEIDPETGELLLLERTQEKRIETNAPELYTEPHNQDEPEE